MLNNKISYTSVAIRLNEFFGYDVFPLIEKKPAVKDWKKHSGIIQTKQELRRLFNRMNITGVGIILNNYLRVLDIDGVKNKETVYVILKALGFSKNYKHVVQSGNGFHIYFYCSDEGKEIEKYFGGKKSFYVLKLKEQYKVKQIELRWENCYIVGPYSTHPSGKQYLFCNGEPKEKAANISASKIVSVVKKYSANNNKTTKNKKNINYDAEKLQAVSDYLKKVHLHYKEWIQCGYAYCEIGEDGRKYFLNMSINEFYPNDTIKFLNWQYDELLKGYIKHKTTLGSLFHYAKINGFKIKSASHKLSAEFLEFVLCVLSYPEKNKKKLLQVILHYSMIEKIRLKKTKEKIKVDLLKPLQRRMQVYESKDIILENHKRMKAYIEIHIKKFGNEPYCRIGEDFFLEVIQGKFDYLSFTILCAITAIQGKKAQWKTITYKRLRAGMEGYKSAAVMKKEIKNYKTVSDYKIRERVKKLRELKIISHITLFRSSYYSTFLEQKVLMDLAEKRHNDKYKRKIENANLQKEFINKIKENEERIKGEITQKIEDIPRSESNDNLFKYS